MNNKRLIEMCLGFSQASSKLRYCRGLISELQITPHNIDQSSVQEEHSGHLAGLELARLRNQVVNAVSTRLRKRLVSVALSKGVVVVGNSLPKVGFWQNPKPLLSINKTGLFVVPKDMMKKDNRKTFWDPLKNPELIKLCSDSTPG